LSLLRWCLVLKRSAGIVRWFAWADHNCFLIWIRNGGSRYIDGNRKENTRRSCDCMQTKKRDRLALNPHVALLTRQKWGASVYHTEQYNTFVRWMRCSSRKMSVHLWQFVSFYLWQSIKNKMSGNLWSVSSVTQLLKVLSSFRAYISIGLRLARSSYSSSGATLRCSASFLFSGWEPCENFDCAFETFFLAVHEDKRNPYL